MNIATKMDVREFSKRQQEVLAAALNLMVEAGDTFTMIAVASRANCSKETLYKWFGDREGLLTATVQWQASKVKIEIPGDDHLDQDNLKQSLERFAANWLTVLSGDISIAINRLAVSHAAGSKSDLGTILLKNGPFAMAERLRPVLELGRNTGLLAFDDTDDAFRSFFGLVVRDMQIRALLGDTITPTVVEPEKDATQATEQFFKLYGTNKQH